MKALVLLSDGRHAVSGQPAPERTELQAIALALGLTSDVTGLHAGPGDDAPHAALGHGLSRLVHRVIAEDDDPLPSILATLDAEVPDLVLAGKQAGAGLQSGLLPYCLARALGWPIVPDAVSLRQENGVLEVIQALPKGARRRWRVTLPAIVTVHSAASAARNFALGPIRAAKVEKSPGIAARVADTEQTEHPYRQRPRLIAPGNAQPSKAGGRLLVDHSPDEAARALLDHLRAIGVLKSEPGKPV